LGKYLVFVLFFLVQHSLFSQLFLKNPSKQAGPSLPIILNHADSLVGKDSPSGALTYLLGNVSLTQGNVQVTCNEAIQNNSLNTVILKGNVVITQGNGRIYSPYVEYYGNSGIAISPNGIRLQDDKSVLTSKYGEYSTQSYIAFFKDSVLIVDPKSVIESKFAEYNRKSKNSIATGFVVFETDSAVLYSDSLFYSPSQKVSSAFGQILLASKFSSSLLEGDSIFYNLSNQSSIVMGYPNAMYVDSSNTSSSNLQDTLYVTGDTLYATRYQEYDEVKVHGNASAIRTTFNSISDSLHIFTFQRNDTMISKFIGRPIIWYDSTQLTGDSIVSITKENELRNIKSFRNSFLLSKSNTKYQDRVDQVEGDTITINFSNQQLHTIYSEGNAQSLYYSYEDDMADGNAKNFADKIEIQFIENKPDLINWKGGIRGEYYPEKFVDGKVNSFNLPRFQIRNDKPKKYYFRSKYLPIHYSRPFKKKSSSN